MVKKIAFDRTSFLQSSTSAVLRCGRPCAPGFRKFESKALQSRCDGFFNKRCITLTAPARSGRGVRMARITQKCLRSCISPSLTENTQAGKMSVRTRTCLLRKIAPDKLFSRKRYKRLSSIGILIPSSQLHAIRLSIFIFVRSLYLIIFQRGDSWFEAGWLRGSTFEENSPRIPTSMKIL